jgi:hypothetical protein
MQCVRRCSHLQYPGESSSTADDRMLLKLKFQASHFHAVRSRESSQAGRVVNFFVPFAFCSALVLANMP